MPIGFNRGSHETSKGFCAMEWLSIIRHHWKTDRPSCTWHGILPAVWHVNDLLTPYHDKGYHQLDAARLAQLERFEQVILNRIPRIIASRFDDQIDQLMSEAALVTVFGPMADDIAGWLARPECGDDLDDSDVQLAEIFARHGKTVTTGLGRHGADTEPKTDQRLYNQIESLGMLDPGDPQIVADLCGLVVTRGEDNDNGYAARVDRLIELCDLFDRAATTVGLAGMQDKAFTEFVSELERSNWSDLTVRVDSQIVAAPHRTFQVGCADRTGS